ncbi:helix-turn-helix domain-containing protein [Achromobacter spanius]|uniref:helix-turn-helix domain-containing protein n=1 Tax=Achromobacter spanius TaxID=217203 RepID=UPI00382AA30B
MNAKPTYTVPAEGNVFKALGFDSVEAGRLLADAQSRLAAQEAMKVQVMDSLSGWMKAEKLNQAQAAQILGTSRPRVSDVVNHKTSKFSIDTLIGFAQAAGKKIELSIR